MERIEEIRRSGRTILLVSRDLADPSKGFAGQSRYFLLTAGEVAGEGARQVL